MGLMGSRRKCSSNAEHRIFRLPLSTRRNARKENWPLTVTPHTLSPHPETRLLTASWTWIVVVGRGSVRRTRGPALRL